jgi:hypothetical protein
VNGAEIRPVAGGNEPANGDQVAGGDQPANRGNGDNGDNFAAYMRVASTGGEDGGLGDSPRTDRTTQRDNGSRPDGTRDEAVRVPPGGNATSRRTPTRARGTASGPTPARIQTARAWFAWATGASWPPTGEVSRHLPTR